MTHIDTTQNTEALLAGAGYAPGTPYGVKSPDIDILVERSGEDRWTVTMISPKALAWAKAELCCVLRQCFAGSMRLDMMSADRLLKQAHAHGFHAEFTSLGGKDLY